MCITDTAPGNFPQVMDAGTNIMFTVPSLKSGQTYYFSVSSYTADGSQSSLSPEVSVSMPKFALLVGSETLSGSVDFLQFPDDNVFGYFSTAGLPWIYHFDMGYEYLIDAGDSQGGAYMYNHTSHSFWYTSPASFPYIYGIR